MGISAGFVCSKWTEVKEERRKSIIFAAANLGNSDRIGPVFLHSDPIIIYLEIKQQELYSLFLPYLFVHLAHKLLNKVTFQNNPVSCVFIAQCAENPYSDLRCHNFPGWGLGL